MALMIFFGLPYLISTARVFIPLLGLLVATMIVGAVFLACVPRDESLAELVPMMANIMQGNKIIFEYLRIISLLNLGRGIGV